MQESIAIAKEVDAKNEFSPTRSDNSIPRLRDEPERQIGSLRGVIGNIRLDGGMPSVESIATQLSGMPTGERAPALLALQQAHGNRYVQRVVSGVQAKLAVGQPGDVYEQEADRVADAVMRMPEPQVQRQVEPEEEEKELLQPKPLAEQITPLIQRQVEIEEEEEEPIQTKKYSGQFLEVTPSINSSIMSMKGGGQPLPKSARAYFEPRFGYDFSQVRVHTDARAADSARAVNARAFTTGQDVVFGAGMYDPGTTTGKQLLAHELTHVIQQGAVHSIVQRTSQGSPQSVNSYTVEQTIRLLDLAFSLVPRALEDTEIPESQKQRIQLLYERLRTLYEQLEHARGTDGSSIVPAFDTTPEAHEINAGDANKSVTELYYPFSVSAPTAQQPPLELQAKFVNNRAPRITQIPSGQAFVQRVACGGICIGIIVLGGLLLAGCSRSSSGAMGAARLRQAEQNFDRKHDQLLQEDERSRIHTGLSSAVGDNTNLLVAFYDYFSNRKIEKASDQQAQAWRSSGHYGETDPRGDMTVNPDILNASFPNNRLGAVLIHEYMHTKHHTNPMGFYDYEEGEAYGVEYYLAERNGDHQRMGAIEAIMLDPSHMVPLPVQQRPFRQSFCKYYGTMKGLYQVIDTGSSTFQGSPFSPLTRDRARAFTVELISLSSDSFSSDLNNILTWVFNHRTEVGMPPTPCN